MLEKIVSIAARLRQTIERFVRLSERVDILQVSFELEANIIALTTRSR